jgi:cytochrome P450
LLDLHGDDHRNRRRLENRLFRRATFEHYERELLPAAIAGTLTPLIAEGSGDLVAIGYRTVMHLTAKIAGIDVPPESVTDLEHLTKLFSRGATAVHAVGDRDQLVREVEQGMVLFQDLFLGPSIDRRRALIANVDAGRLGEDELPRDVLTTLLHNVDDLELPPDVIRREIAFYLQAGGHSTANALTHTLDELWTSGGSELVSRAARDRRFLQRCVHEALRLHPASPIAQRRALEACQLPSGTRVAEGSIVVVDLEAANREAALWGDRAERFDPDRPVPESSTPWGLSFGSGMHACIGMELDGGVLAEDAIDTELYGTVTLLAGALLDARARPDPHRPPTQDPASARLHFSNYPVLFGDHRSTSSPDSSRMMTA